MATDYSTTTLQKVNALLRSTTIKTQLEVMFQLMGLGECLGNVTSATIKTVLKQTILAGRGGASL